MKENVRPTRMELLNTKQKLVLAEKGHKLLKQKRDALVLEFFQVIKQAKDLRSKVDEEMVLAYKSLAIASAFHGELYIKTVALSSQNAPSIQVSSKNIMGVKIPCIITCGVESSFSQRGYGIKGSSAKLDEAVEHFQLALSYIVQLAATETSLKRLLREVEKTNRRVNALEYNIQPDLKDTIKQIASHLNRLEAERFFALKVTKKRLQRKAEEGG